MFSAHFDLLEGIAEHDAAVAFLLQVKVVTKRFQRWPTMFRQARSQSIGPPSERLRSVPRLSPYRVQLLR